MENTSNEIKIHVCCIPFCQQKSTNEKVFYFPFPHHDHELLKKWILKIGKNNFKLTKNTFICSKHFLDIDIDKHPNRKLPVLKSTAVPQIFNDAFKNMKLQNNDKNIITLNKKNVNAIQIPQDKIIEQIDDNDDVEILSTNKIIKKIDKPSVRYLTQVKKLSPEKNINNSPCIMIIPKFDNKKAPSTVTNVMIQPHKISLTNKATLRITINKKINIDQNKNDDNNKFQIKNNKDNTIIKYTLDPITGNIKMTKEKQQTINGQITLFNRRKSFRNRRTINSLNSSKFADGVKNDITQVEAECDSLEKRHKNLTQTQKLLKEKKQKLQNDIEEMKAKVKRTLNDTSKIPVDNKKKKVDDNLPYETRTRKKIQSMNINNFSTPENDIEVNNTSTNKIEQENVINNIEFVDIDKIKSLELNVKTE